MKKNREQQKELKKQQETVKQEQIHKLQLEMRQAYREGNQGRANEIMQKIRELREDAKK